MAGEDGAAPSTEHHLVAAEIGPQRGGRASGEDVPDVGSPIRKRANTGGRQAKSRAKARIDKVKRAEARQGTVSSSDEDEVVEVKRPKSQGEDGAPEGDEVQEVPARVPDPGCYPIPPGRHCDNFSWGILGVGDS